jgi:hypothetical protein
MRDITNIQEAFVADHIAALRDEGSALRAERERDHARDDFAEGTDASEHRFEAASRRVRIGHWLVAFGEAIAGSKRSAERSRSRVTGSDGSNDPCGDSHDRLVPAA